MKNITRIAIILIVLINLFCAASVTKIGQIREEPTRFHEKFVSVTGTVEDVFAIPLIDVVLIKLDDGTGSLWVKPVDGDNIPRTGVRIHVTGEIKTGITFSGKTFGILLFEQNPDKPM